MYSITFKLGDSKPDVQLLSYSKTFSKKPIQQIEVIPEYQLLICLSDNLICVHDLGAINFPLISTVQRTKGATLFCLDFKVIIYKFIKEDNKSVSSAGKINFLFYLKRP